MDQRIPAIDHRGVRAPDHQSVPLGANRAQRLAVGVIDRPKPVTGGDVGTQIDVKVEDPGAPGADQALERDSRLGAGSTSSIGSIMSRAARTRRTPAIPASTA